MRALITGVNGFVGGYLSEYLLQNNMEVWGTKLPSEIKEKSHNDKVIIRDLDITNKEQVYSVIEECKPDYIFHLAAQSSVALSWKEPRLTMDVNVNGTINLLQAVNEVDNNAKILLIGSSEEYGIIKPESVPINEEYALKPANPYAVSKMAQEELAKQFVKAYSMNIVIVRAFNHIGPKQSPAFVVSDFAKRIVQMEKGLIEPKLLVGNLESKRDFTDVRDIVKAYYLLIQKGVSGEIYNIGSGKVYKVREILDMLLSKSKIDIEVLNDPNRMRPSDAPIIQCDNKKLKELTGWDIEYSLEKTIDDVIEYWRKA